jgi:hypothetical protein
MLTLQLSDTSSARDHRKVEKLRKTLPAAASVRQQIAALDDTVQSISTRLSSATTDAKETIFFPVQIQCVTPRTKCLLFMLQEAPDRESTESHRRLGLMVRYERGMHMRCSHASKVK